MDLVLNGDRRTMDDGASVADLVRRLDLAPERVAVEVNGTLVRRAAYAETTLAEGDRVEIVTLVGGG